MKVDMGKYDNDGCRLTVDTFITSNYFIKQKFIYLFHVFIYL